MLGDNLMSEIQSLIAQLKVEVARMQKVVDAAREWRHVHTINDRINLTEAVDEYEKDKAE